MSVENNQDNELEELRVEAEELGIEVHPRAGIAKIRKAIEDKEAEIAEKQKAKKDLKANAKGKKVRVTIESREGDDAPVDQFFAYNSMATGARESILIQFGEEIEISEAMYEHIKSIKYGEKKFKIVPDEDGIPQKHWYTKKKQRFIISKD